MLVWWGSNISTEALLLPLPEELESLNSKALHRMYKIPRSKNSAAHSLTHQTENVMWYSSITLSCANPGHSTGYPVQSRPYLMYPVQSVWWYGGRGTARSRRWRWRTYGVFGLTNEMTLNDSIQHPRSRHGANLSVIYRFSIVSTTS